MCARPHQGKFNKHTAPGDTLTDFFSDTGSTPVSSTILCKSELNLLCEVLFRICFCFRGCGSVHILFFRRIVSKRLFSIPDASRGRVAPANPRAAYMRPLQRNKNKKPLTSNEISGFWQDFAHSVRTHHHSQHRRFLASARSSCRCRYN